MILRAHRMTLGLVVLAGTAGTALAQPIMWNAASGGWNSAANWDPMNVPNVATEDAILGGAGAYTVDLDTSPTIGGLHITNSAAMLSLNAGRTLTLTQASTNNGLVLFNPQGSASNATLTISTNPVTLTGLGEFRMLTGADNSQIVSLNGGVLTNGMGHTIRGVGIISAILDNQGSIAADASISVSGADLTLTSGAKSNSGTMSAGTGSTLTFSSVGVMQTPGGQIRADGGTVNIASSTITGGQLAGTTSYVATAGTVVLDSVTASTGGIINPGVVIAVAGSGLTNNAILALNPVGSASNSILRFDVSASLAGAGEVHLMTGAENSQVNTAINATLTHSATHTIRGVGQMASVLVNNGEVWADIGVRVPGTSFDQLTLVTTPVTNNHIIGAKSGSVLSINSIPVNQAGGGQLRAEDGLIEFNSAGLTGGAINAAGTGSYAVASGTTTFTGVTSNCPGQINAGSVLGIAGTGLTNNASLTLNPQASASNSTLRFDVSGGLSGTGELLLRTGADNSQVITAAGAVITHGASHTIRGAGQIPANLVNNGTIASDPSVVLAGGTDLALTTVNKANNALIEARTGSSVSITGITLDQTGGGQLRADGGTINFSAASLLGGQITTTGSGSWAVASGTNSFNAVTSNAPGAIGAGTVLVVNGGSLVNNAVITMNPESSASNAVLVYNTSGTLSGTGTVVLRAGSDNSQINTSSAVQLTHAAGHSVVGEGQINAGAGGSFINHGRLAPGPIAGGAATIAVSGALSQPTGTLHIEIGGTATTAFDRLIGSGVYTLGGTLDVDLIGGYTPVRQHSMRIIAGTSVTDRFDTVLRPTLPAGVAMRVVYLANAVDIWFHCPPDLTTGAIPGQVGYGVPNGTLNNDDFFFYLGIFASGDPDADLTTGAIPGQPGFGVPNGVITNDDFFYYLTIFAGGC